MEQRIEFDEVGTMEEGLLEAFAARALVYQLFHVVFGGEVGTDISEAMSPHALGDATAVLEAMGFDKSGLPDVEQVLRMAGARDMDAAQVRAQYEKLFMVPGKCYLKPWESVYAGGENQMFAPSTLDVRERYRALGFQAVEKGRYPEDHIAMMLGVMGASALRVWENASKGDAEAALADMRAQEDFARTHLLNWVGLLADRAADADESGLYASLAANVVQFVSDDVQFTNCVAHCLASIPKTAGLSAGSARRVPK